MKLLNSVDINHIKLLEAYGYDVEFDIEREKFHVRKTHPRFGHMGSMINFDIGGIRNYVSGLIDGMAIAQDKWWFDVQLEKQAHKNKLKCRIPARYLDDGARKARKAI